MSTDLRVLKTKRNIQQALFSLLIQGQSYSLVTIDQICREALCSRSTFYAHYTQKNDLLEEITDHYVSQFQKFLTRRLESSQTTHFEYISQQLINQFILPSQPQLRVLLAIRNDPALGLEEKFQKVIITELSKKSTKSRTLIKLYAVNVTTIFKMLVNNELCSQDLQQLSVWQEKLGLTE